MVSKLLFNKKPNKNPEFDIEEIREKLKETSFEKNDGLALIIAALVTIVPTMLIVIGSILGVIWFIFLR